MKTDKFIESIKFLLENKCKKNMPYKKYLSMKYGKYKYVCIFGTGNMGATLPRELHKQGIKVSCFCDNNPQKVGEIIQGIPCISLEQLIEQKDNTMVVIATRYYKEIYTQLRHMDFCHIDRVFDNKFAIDEYIDRSGIDSIMKKVAIIINKLADEKSCYVLMRIIEEWCRNEYAYGQLDDIYSEPQYFDQQIVPLCEDEIFVDCGAYDGDTFCDYMKYSQGKFKQAYLFELSKKNYSQLNFNISKNYPELKKKIVLENYGVAGQCGEIVYFDDDEGSSISENGETKGRIITLDEYFKNKEVTFIKMDIEGAEMDALLGMKEIIHRCHPKLAVCLYHKPEDLFEIPLFMIKNFEGYHYYIRHHTDLLNETVLYAIPKV